MAALVELTDGLNYYRPNVFDFNIMNIILAIGKPHVNLGIFVP